MNTFLRIVSLILGIVVVCLLSTIFLWQYGWNGLWLPPSAVFGALLAMIASQMLLSRAMMGIASIIGGIVGAMASGIDTAPCIHSGSPATPYVIFVGAAIGGAIWIIILSMPVSSKASFPLKLCGIRQSEEKLEDKKSEYLLISLVTFVGGLVLGPIFCLIYHVCVGIEPVDQWYICGHHFNGAIGAVLSSAIIGAIGGSLLGVPYFMAWLMKK